MERYHERTSKKQENPGCWKLVLLQEPGMDRFCARVDTAGINSGIRNYQGCDYVIGKSKAQGIFLEVVVKISDMTRAGI